MHQPASSRITRTLATWGAALLGVRWVVRAPIWLYQTRLGILLGSRLLMLEHIGRQSGTTRYAVLEVIDHPTPDTYVVVSGFGNRAQWFRNVRANHTCASTSAATHQSRDGAAAHPEADGRSAGSLFDRAPPSLGHTETRPRKWSTP
jgi:deazaflavin-dependent oxidoreductase (nitroreductase family)